MAMGLSDWFKKRPRPGPKVVGRSAGGSRLVKYGGEFHATPLGFPDADVSGLAERREAIYDELFGTHSAVHHEVLPLIPHIDVYVIPPRSERGFFTLVTGGMSDLPMNSPAEFGADARRVELVFYTDAERPEYVDLLRTLAHFTHDQRTWLHWGHTLPHGTPSTPIFGKGPLDTFYFMDSIIAEDHTLGERLAWAGDPVNLLWLVPITTAECALKLEHGSQALLDLFQRVHHPMVFTGGRASYV
jgi:hypothetical protein